MDEMTLVRGEAEFLLVQCVDGRDDGFARGVYSYLSSRTEKGFALVSVRVDDWYADLSPWEAPPVFGGRAFAGKARDTLAYLTGSVLPRALSGLPGNVRIVSGGYSLSALFALWEGYNHEGLYGVAAASPSVWFNGWDAYIREREMLCKNVYLSVGDSEEKAKNPVTALVGDRIRDTFSVLSSQGVSAVLEYNEGNHFRDADIRTAKAFLNIMER